MPRRGKEGPVCGLCQHFVPLDGARGTQIVSSPTRLYVVPEQTGACIPQSNTHTIVVDSLDKCEYKDGEGFKFDKYRRPPSYIKLDEEFES